MASENSFNAIPDLGNFTNQLEIILDKGGIMMMPLGLCSFLVVLIIIERMIALRRGKLISDKQFAAWSRWMDLDFESKALPRFRSGSVLNRILQSISSYLPLPQDRLEERFSDLARREKHKLERGLVLLDTIAGIAPLFGLLGTALGMVEVFSRLSVTSESKMSALSSGISEALFTTVAGLCIGIPSLIAFNLFSRHIDKVLITTEDQLNQLIDKHYKKLVVC